jgi:hypothetical protein
MDPLHDPDDFLSQLANSPAMTFHVDLDRSTVIPGSPGIWDGLVIAQWSNDEENAA